MLVHAVLHWVCLSAFHYYVIMLGPRHMVLTIEQPACRPKPKCSLLGKESAPTLVFSRWHLIVTRFENSHLPLSESTPDGIVSFLVQPDK